MKFLFLATIILFANCKTNPSSSSKDLTEADLNILLSLSDKKDTLTFYSADEDDIQVPNTGKRTLVFSNGPGYAIKSKNILFGIDGEHFPVEFPLKFVMNQKQFMTCQKYGVEFCNYGESIADWRTKWTNGSECLFRVPFKILVLKDTFETWGTTTQKFKNIVAIFSVPNGTDANCDEFGGKKDIEYRFRSVNLPQN